MPIEERRSKPFVERLSFFMAAVAATGAFLVLLDPTFTFTILGQTIKIGGDGFSADLKGAAVSLILIGGWTAVKEYWLGSSAGSVQKDVTLQKMASSSTPAMQQAEVVIVPDAAPQPPTKGVIP